MVMKGGSKPYTLHLSSSESSCSLQFARPLHMRLWSIQKTCVCGQRARPFLGFKQYSLFWHVNSLHSPGYKQKVETNSIGYNMVLTPIFTWQFEWNSGPDHLKAHDFLRGNLFAPLVLTRVVDAWNPLIKERVFVFSIYLRRRDVTRKPNRDRNIDPQHSFVCQQLLYLIRSLLLVEISTFSSKFL